MSDSKDRLKFFDSDKLDEALSQAYRLYLTGHLELPQEELKHFDDIATEVGISDYKDYKADLPHVHMFNTEFNYVLKGKVKVVLTESGEEYLFDAGSMFIIEPGMPYCTKATKGTRVLFFKTPGGYDKGLVPATSELEHWRKSWENSWDMDMQPDENDKGKMAGMQGFEPR